MQNYEFILDTAKRFLLLSISKVIKLAEKKKAQGRVCTALFYATSVPDNFRHLLPRYFYKPTHSGLLVKCLFFFLDFKGNWNWNCLATWVKVFFIELNKSIRPKFRRWYYDTDRQIDRKTGILRKACSLTL